MRIYLADTALYDLRNAISLASTFPGAQPSAIRILLSYHYYKQQDMRADLLDYFPTVPEIFLDSGAFSAMTQGATISLEHYAHYIQQQRDIITTYANLDVIKNAEATWVNQRRLEEEYGLHPLPVFHVTEPWSYFDRYLERYPYIALGVAGTPLSVYMPWLIKCFKIARGTKTVFHGFGMTNWITLKSFPWYSVDSTSWNRAGRYGIVWLFDERKYCLQDIRVGSARSKYYGYAKLLRQYGLDPAVFDTSGSPVLRASGNAVSVYALWQVERAMEKWYGHITIPEREEIA